ISRQQDLRPSTPETSVQHRTRLSLWDVAGNRELHGVDIEGVVTGAAMSSDGSRVAWSIESGKLGARWELRVWGTGTGQDVWSRSDWGTRAGYNRLGTPQFSRDGKTLVVATGRASGPSVASRTMNLMTFDANIHILDAATGSNLRPPVFSPDGVLDQL